MKVGIEILHGPVVTDWETESLLVSGPAGLVIDFYHCKWEAWSFNVSLAILSELKMNYEDRSHRSFVTNLL